MYTKSRRFIPNEYYKSVYDVEYERLYKEGFRLILTDLDNTLINYEDKLPNNKTKEWYDKVINIGFDVVMISNNKKKRVMPFAEMLNMKAVYLATKPFKRGFKKALKLSEYNIEQAFVLGDLLLTDIYGGNKMGIYTILIEAIKRTHERRLTKMNRFIEKRYLNRIKKKYSDDYNRVLKEYDDNYGL